MSGTLDQEDTVVATVMSNDTSIAPVVHVNKTNEIMAKTTIKNEDDVKKPSLTHLYLARTLAAWGDRTWQFVGGMFMIK